MWDYPKGQSQIDVCDYQGLSAGVGAKTRPPGPHQKTVIFSG
jgi:hypothetical protein